MKTANELIENSSAQLGCSAAVVTFAAAAVAAATYVDERLIMIMNIIHKHMCLQYNFKIYYNSVQHGFEDELQRKKANEEIK